jgi:single-strand DNA-binding protein
MLTLEGKLIKVLDTKVTNNGFAKRMFYIDDCAQKFRNVFVLELWKDDCNMIDNYKQGDWIKVYVDIKGIFWSDEKGEMIAKNTLKCWNIEKDGVTQKKI